MLEFLQNEKVKILINGNREVKNLKSHTFINKFNKNVNFLGRKRSFEEMVNNNQIQKPLNVKNTQMTSNKLVELIKKGGENEKDSILPRKINFKLSHILQGENTQISSEAQQNIKNNHELFNDYFIHELMIKKPNFTNPCGLNNLGNTCFLNSVLQCILHTNPLRNYISQDHMKQCKIKGICYICELGRLINFSNQGRNSITPSNITQNIKGISPHLRVGRQEDAHEFLIYFLDALEKSSKLFKNASTTKFISQNSKDDMDNLIKKLFLGKMVSSVTCLQCKHVSKKVDNFLDISLDINNSDSLEKCFINFCKSENLNGNNKFLCEQCKKKQDSLKKFTFEKCKKLF
jgi:ubiquitin C-terminal hydrolase